MTKFVFIGGTFRGFELLSSLVKANKLPSLIFIMEEDIHEEKKYSKDIVELAKTIGVEYFVAKKLSKEHETLISNTIWDFAIVCGWRTIINPELNRCFKLGILAAHDSLLPKYRGFAPTNWALINGEKSTGVTLFIINNGEVDSGDIVGQIEVPINFDDYAWDIMLKITQATIDVVNQFICYYEKKDVQIIKQNELDATYTCKRTPEDGKISWQNSSIQIYNLIRGLAPPYPCAYTSFDGITYKIRKAVLGDLNSKNFVGRIPGRIIKIDDFGVEILCGTGSLKILEWQKSHSQVIESPNKSIKSIRSTLT